jgi:hypothetical protein
MKTAVEYLYIIGQNNSDISPINEQLTLTDIFHQFDTITLRGRTSIDRYLNIQRAKEFAQQSQIENEQQSRLGPSRVVETLQGADGYNQIQYPNSSVKHNEERKQ